MNPCGWCCTCQSIVEGEDDDNLDDGKHEHVLPLEMNPCRWCCTCQSIVQREDDYDLDDGKHEHVLPLEK
jgi:hypothetical protein